MKAPEPRVYNGQVGVIGGMIGPVIGTDIANNRRWSVAVWIDNALRPGPRQRSGSYFTLSINACAAAGARCLAPEIK